MFSTVDAPGASETQLLGLNDRGFAVGFDDVNGVMNGIVFNSALDAFTNINPRGSMGTTLNGINDLNKLVGFYVDAAGNTDGLLVTGAPEPATWTMLLAGFASLGFAGCRASRRRAAIAG
ncbi:MAG TPA: PEP-CTERM sorting domain-containing protein [Roseiarcus sp.]|nr:PEP-CTERM sorting domain-containing protein [Roseiarcus sp.]